MTKLDALNVVVGTLALVLLYFVVEIELAFFDFVLKIQAMSNGSSFDLHKTLSLSKVVFVFYILAPILGTMIWYSKRKNGEWTVVFKIGLGIVFLSFFAQLFNFAFSILFLFPYLN